MKISFPYLGTSNSKFKLNLTQWVTGSLVFIYYTNDIGTTLFVTMIRSECDKNLKIIIGNLV